MPGPGDYNTERPVRVAGGKFNVSDPKRFIDQVQAEGAPAPQPAVRVAPQAPAPPIRRARAAGRRNAARTAAGS